MNSHLRRLAGLVIALGVSGAAGFGQMYNQTTLVVNTGTATTTDPSLVNGWGIARGSGTPWWVSDNLTGVSTLYSGSGAKLPVTVTIPAAKTGAMGSPTGVIYNGNTMTFLLPDGKSAAFIFCTVDGTISGWHSGLGTSAVIEVKTTDGSSYTGLTSTMVNGEPRLYAANFTLGTVDVYDSSFHLVARGGGHFGDHGPGEWGRSGDDDDGGYGHFFDDHLPPHYVPFNVQAIGSDIVVTYALHFPGQMFETDGPGNGYVDIYSASGRLLQRLQHGNWLNAPWGVALAPLDFGAFSHDLLVGQFAGGGTTQSSGYIVAYDMATGRMKGLLEDASGTPLAINGIWGISFGGNVANNYDSAGAPAAEMYFAAGPNHGAGGVFGFLTPIAADLIQGNDQ
ncbi:MAG TPA: TIGR03118 family protein [Terracidiphilus sp.]|nr:TIGR03118 family protein [Terracidiphilus sp.]